MIVNLQRKIPLRTSDFREFVAKIKKHVSEVDGAEFAIAFVSDRRITELNRFFRGKDSPTDVLSFPNRPEEFEVSEMLSANGAETPASRFLGDIVISTEQAMRQADEAGHDLKREIEQLILHGVLHLCGYDHETDDGQMDRRELELRGALDIE